MDSTHNDRSSLLSRYFSEIRAYPLHAAAPPCPLAFRCSGAAFPPTDVSRKCGKPRNCCENRGSATVLRVDTATQYAYTKLVREVSVGGNAAPEHLNARGHGEAAA